MKGCLINQTWINGPTCMFSNLVVVFNMEIISMISGCHRLCIMMPVLSMMVSAVVVVAPYIVNG